MARIGTAIALGFSVPIARATGIIDVSRPLLVALIALCIGLIVFVVYNLMDMKLDKSEVAANELNEADEEEDFKLSDIGKILNNKGWWYIAILCVLFYSAVFPFLKYATDLMVNKFGVDQNIAGMIPMLLPFGNILLTPLFGGIYDKKGKGATIMIIGSILLIIVHGLFSIPGLNSWVTAMILVVVLGIAFSLVPSAMWPSVPKIIPEKRLGTAYSLIFWVQNWGLMGVPLLIGWVLEKYCITGQTIRDGMTVNTYDYTLPMMIFAGFGVLALVFAFLLKAEDKKKGYGLESPNIQH
jgi:predicted MFS family arabinose efflux permease